MAPPEGTLAATTAVKAVPVETQQGGMRVVNLGGGGGGGGAGQARGQGREQWGEG